MKFMRVAAIAVVLALLSPPPSSAAVAVTPATGADVMRAVHDAKAPAVLVNVWATWCIPCREEFPELVRLRQSYLSRGLRVLFVSGDFNSELPQVREFLAEQKVDFPTFIKTGPDMEFINSFDPKWSGALPATFIFDRRGVLQHSFLRKVSYAELAQAVDEVLKTGSTSKGD